MNKYFLCIVFLCTVCFNVNARNFGPSGDSTEVLIIDSYVTPETPHKLLLSFSTSDSCKAKLIVEGKGEYVVSDQFTENHRIELDMQNIKITSAVLTFQIKLEKKNKKTELSERYEVEMPYEQVVENSGNFITTCLFGGIVFLTPSPTYIYSKNSSTTELFGLSKEIPLVSFYSGGFNYPKGYFSAEYSHIFKSDSKYTPKNTLRVGYKHIIEIPILEYVSPGVSGFTSFKGFNGISPEISIGFFNVYNVFTVCGKYRFNFTPNQKDNQFHELSIGLMSNFFSIHL